MAEPQAGRFDIYTSQEGYHLNRLWHMLNVGKKRAALLADKDVYLDRFPLSAGERDAISRVSLGWADPCISPPSWP